MNVAFPFALLVVISCCKILDSLECYICEEQEGNDDKCKKTVKQCNEGEDVCASFVSWTLPQEFSPQNERRHYITKACDTKPNCRQSIEMTASICTRHRYYDSLCVECCEGDRCNYYVTLNSNTTKSSLILTIISLTLTCFFRRDILF
ncbi:hypothetical protein SNEBB_002446 [Seison nebaliae]|nr:hypothetical protein SNEBB_002446 [Seison nebaliae]